MAFFADYHTHTEHSGDSETPMESMVQRGIDLGLRQLVVTDHVDYDYADPSFAQIDYAEYSREVSRMQSKYGHKIQLLMGVEVGYQPHVADQIRCLLSEYAFDFVICSTHMADQLDFYTGAFFEGKNATAAYQRYFEYVLEGIKIMDDFDVYGHLDFIVRYGEYPVKELDYFDYADIVDEILRQIIYRGKGIEMNTSGFRYGLKHLHPQPEILKRYRKMGGEIITVGSDAHVPEDMCSHFKEVYDVLHGIGYKYQAVYQRRQVQFIKIP